MTSTMARPTCPAPQIQRCRSGAATGSISQSSTIPGGEPGPGVPAPGRWRGATPRGRTAWRRAAPPGRRTTGSAHPVSRGGAASQVSVTSTTAPPQHCPSEGPRASRVDPGVAPGKYRPRPAPPPPIRGAPRRRWCPLLPALPDQHRGPRPRGARAPGPRAITTPRKPCRAGRWPRRGPRGRAPRPRPVAPPASTGFGRRGARRSGPPRPAGGTGRRKREPGRDAEHQRRLAHRLRAVTVSSRFAPSQSATLRRGAGPNRPGIL